MSSKTVDENYKRLRAELDDLLSKDKRLTAIADKIAKGAADFSDTARYTQIVSKHMSDVIKRNIGELKQAMAKEMVCKELLRDHYDLINGAFGEVQVSVDEKLGVHLDVKKPAYPAERVDKWAHSLEDPTVEQSVIERRAASGSENIGNSIHDDCIDVNAELRDQAGLDCYLTRDAGGGCCSWCQALEGRYNYADAPDDIFRRHDNCTCTVTYECGRMRQDVWSKKTWEADPKDVEARIEASEAAKPTVKTPAEAQALNEQSKSNITVLSKEQAEALNKQSQPTVHTPEQAAELNKQLLSKEDNNDKMSSASDMVLEPQKPTIHTKEEIEEITKYASDNGIKLYQPQNFDGDISVLKDQIDAISEIRNEYGLTSKLTVEFKDLRGGDLAETSRTGASITFDRNALRNREATNKFLQANNILATNDVKGIAYHEMGHILSKTYGEKGLDIASKAYYNIYRKIPTNSELLDYLEHNVSEYSTYVSDIKKYPYKEKDFKEVTPELLSKDKTVPTDYSGEFIRLMKEAYHL